MKEKEELKKLQREFKTLPEKGKYNLGGRGVVLLIKINKLEGIIKRKEYRRNKK